MAHVETFRGVAKGDRLWQLGLGGGFKCTSGVWRAVRAVSEAHAAWGPGVGAAAEGDAAAAPAAGACMLDEVRGGREGLRRGAGCRARAVRPPLPPSSLRPPPCRLRPRRDPPPTHHTPARRARGATRASRVGGRRAAAPQRACNFFLAAGPPGPAAAR